MIIFLNEWAIYPLELDMEFALFVKVYKPNVITAI